jgi:hypothetical protein
MLGEFLKMSANTKQDGTLSNFAPVVLEVCQG